MFVKKCNFLLSYSLPLNPKSDRKYDISNIPNKRKYSVHALLTQGSIFKVVKEPNLT